MNALYHIHSFNLIHRDIKPENVLLSKNGSVFLSDLGIILDDKHKNTASIMGTSSYLAPEVLKHEYSSKVDIYSLGCLMYFVCTNKVPDSIFLYGNEEEDLSRWKLSEPYSKYYGFQDILNQMLRKSPKDRINTDQLMNYLKIIHMNYKSNLKY